MTKKVRVQWASETEQLDGEYDHAMLIVPEGPDSHRIYFVSTSAVQLGQMLAIAMEMGARNGGGRALDIAMQIIGDGKPGTFRGERAAGWPEDRKKS